MGDEYSNDEHAMAIAGALLGEEPAAETPAETQETATEESTETVTETAEEESATAAPEEAEVDGIMVPLKGLQEEKRKRQEIEARAQSLEERLKELEEKVQPKEETDDDIFAQDPEGTVARINAKIAQLANDDPYGNAAEIEYWRDKKTTLRENYVNRQAVSNQKFSNELLKAVPDIQTRQNDYRDFALTELGYDAKTLETLSNPKIVGEVAAVKFTKTIADQFKKAEAAKTVQQKAVKPQPTKSEPPGQGVPVQAQDLGKLKQEAIASGDWSKYLDAAGAL